LPVGGVYPPCANAQEIPSGWVIDHEWRAPLVAALHRLKIIGPDSILGLGSAVANRHYLGRFATTEMRDGFIHDVNELNYALRDDLVPKQMR
jgi:hypothetical protein